jgi:hypothetical protein
MSVIIVRLQFADVSRTVLEWSERVVVVLATWNCSLSVHTDAYLNGEMWFLGGGNQFYRVLAVAERFEES